MGLLDRFRTRTTGIPPSGNGASSFHLFWGMPAADPFVEVSVAFVLEQEPRTDRLYFWALQASFAEHGRTYGAGHLGFQWSRSHPDRRGVCWGGYGGAGGELSGGVPFFPTPDDNHNVCSVPWTSGEEWRWRIRRSPDVPGAWRAEIEDASGDVHAVRDLYCDGRHLTDLMVWSEVFARCDDAPVVVRWSDFRAVTEAGDVVRPTVLHVNYQRYEDGGCDNTTVRHDPDGVRQITNAVRDVAQGTQLTL